MYKFLLSRSRIKVMQLSRVGNNEKVDKVMVLFLTDRLVTQEVKLLLALKF